MRTYNACEFRGPVDAVQEFQDTDAGTNDAVKSNNPLRSSLNAG
jgi:hypothetical protein